MVTGWAGMLAARRVRGVGDVAEGGRVRDVCVCGGGYVIAWAAGGVQCWQWWSRWWCDAIRGLCGAGGAVRLNGLVCCAGCRFRTSACLA